MTGCMKAAYTIALSVGFVACITDVKSRRIPNVLTFGAALAGVVYSALFKQE